MEQKPDPDTRRNDPSAEWTNPNMKDPNSHTRLQKHTQILRGLSNTFIREPKLRTRKISCTKYFYFCPMCSRICGTAVIFTQIEIKRGTWCSYNSWPKKSTVEDLSRKRKLVCSLVIAEEIFTDLSWALCTNRKPIPACTTSSKKQKLTDLILIWQTGGLSNHLPSMSLKGPFPDFPH